MPGVLNSFDLLRLAAALAVILHHCRPFAGEAPWRIFHFDLGALGVGVFFVISGYLVTASQGRSQGLWDYLRKRVLRIAPGLVVSLLVTALAMGALVTALSPTDYLAHPQTWLYVLRNALLYPVTYALPGVFADNPVTAVNPSLWTLRFEFTLYVVLGLLGAAGLWRRGVVAGLALASVAVVAFCVLRPDLAAERPFRIAMIGGQFSFLFLAGAWIQLQHQARGRRLPLWSLLSLGFLATPLWVLALPAAVILVGELRSFRLPADVSYGLYIYACPVQQILMMHGLLSFWTSVAFTLPLALASWFLVERPALRFKRATRGPPPPR